MKLIWQLTTPADDFIYLKVTANNQVEVFEAYKAIELLHQRSNVTFEQVETPEDDY